jgi:hypothetical protein
VKPGALQAAGGPQGDPPRKTVAKIEIFLGAPLPGFRQGNATCAIASLQDRVVQEAAERQPDALAGGR